MKFIIATGGTGGHLIPALKVAEELKAKGHTIILLGSFDRAREQVQHCGFPFEELDARGFVFTLRKEMFTSTIAMIKAVNKAFHYLKNSKPDAVLGFGGYGAFPVVLSAVWLRYPTLIHEQNVVPGRANALLAKFVKKIAISFRKSTQYFNSEKTILTGCPCRAPQERVNREALLKTFQLKPGLMTILVFGGSQGSRHINEVFVEAIDELKGNLDFQVIHVSGQRDYQKLLSRYNQMGIPFALFEYLDKMEEAYHVANLVISRSGAATVSEIAGFQLPAIFIPYPLAQGHQKENASVLRETKSIRIIEDKDLSVARLKEDILDMLKISPQGKNQSEVFKTVYFPDAAKRLAEEAVSLKI